MSVETLIDNDLVSMWYYPDKKIVHHKIHKCLYGEYLRAAMETGLTTLIKHNACKWLSDDSRFSALQMEDVTWGKTIWTPKAVQAGWRFWAVVLPKSVTGKMSHTRMIDDHRALGITVTVFNDVEKAMAWLAAQ